MSVSVSIIICTANKPESLAQTLQSLMELEIPNEMRTELVVVDNHPDTASQTVSDACLQNMTVRYVEEPRRGQSYARNRGLACATGEVIIFTDDDLRVPKDWVQKLIEPIVLGNADAVAGTIRIAPDLERSWMTAYHKAYYAQIGDSSQGSYYLVGANMAFHRRVLECVPEFDVCLGPGALGFADDSLFSIRLEDAGFQLVFNSNAEVVHCFDAARLQRASLIKHAEQLGRSWGYVEHHWNQSQVSAPALRRLRKALQIKMRRAMQANKVMADEGCPEVELFEVHGWAFIDQYIKEQATPPKYQRTGLKHPRRNPVAALVSDLLNRVPSKG